MITLKIPCKTYVKKYLIARYGLQHTITKTSFLGFFLYDKLNKNFAGKSEYKNLDDTYDVILTEWIVKSDGHCISNIQLQQIGHALTLLFRDDLLDHVKNDQKKDVNASAAIKSFLNKYNITEKDLKFESVYRDYKRKKAKKGTKF